MTTETIEKIPDVTRVVREDGRVVIVVEQSGVTIAKSYLTPAAALALVGQLSLAAAALIAEGQK